jgi:hypothetical protein
MKMKIKFHSEQELVNDIVNNAKFVRLLNILQDNGHGCVDYKKYVDIRNLRTILFWDIYEYITKTEWKCSETVEERQKKMRPMCFGNQNEWRFGGFRLSCLPKKAGGREIKCKFYKECHKKTFGVKR